MSGLTEGYTDASIFLPAAGWGSGSAFYGSGTFGYYLSSSLPSDDSDPWHQSACDLQFKKTGFAQYDYYRYAGLTVRPVR